MASSKALARTFMVRHITAASAERDAWSVTRRSEAPMLRDGREKGNSEEEERGGKAQKPARSVGGLVMFAMVLRIL